MDRSNFVMLRKALVRCAIWLSALVALVYLCSYVIDALKRSIRAPDCQWNTVPNPDSAPYSARYCWLSKQEILLRLHGGAGHLIAERTYPYSNIPFFVWSPDKLIFDTYPDDAFIALPPSLFERLRAKLP